MKTVRYGAVALTLTAIAFSTGAPAQTGSLWHGLIDANIPMELYVERFTAERVEGRVSFGQARFGYAGINQLCDSARLVATRSGDRYAYRISGACGGKGTLRVSDEDPDRIEGRGTIFDAATASAFKRRHFYLERD